MDKYLLKTYDEIIKKKLILSFFKILAVIRDSYKKRFITAFPTIISSCSLSQIGLSFLTQYLKVDYCILNVISQIAKSKQLRNSLIVNLSGKPKIFLIFNLSYPNMSLIKSVFLRF